MYYEEKWMNGILYCRSTPNSDWCEFTATEYSARIKEREEEIIALQHEAEGFIKDNLFLISNQIQ